VDQLEALACFDADRWLLHLRHVVAFTAITIAVTTTTTTTTTYITVIIVFGVSFRTLTT
jgi:hypothetical protein